MGSFSQTGGFCPHFVAPLIWGGNGPLLYKGVFFPLTPLRRVGVPFRGALVFWKLGNFFPPVCFLKKPFSLGVGWCVVTAPLFFGSV